MTFVMVAGLSLTMLILIPYILKIRFTGNEIFWFCTAVTLLIYYVVPIGLALLGEINCLYVEQLCIDNSILKYTGIVLSNLVLLLMNLGYIYGQSLFRQSRQNQILFQERHTCIQSVNVITSLGLIILYVSKPTSIGRLAFSPTSVFSSISIGRYLSYGASISVFHGVWTRRFSVHTLLNTITFLLIYLIKFADRAPALAVLLAGLFAVTTKNNKRGHGFSKLIGLVLIISVIFVGVSWQYVRWNWRSTDGILALIRVGKEAFVRGPIFSLKMGELGYLYKAYQGIQSITDHNRLLLGKSYVRMILAPIPSSVFPMKPRETQLLVAKLFGVEWVGASRPPTFIGDAYLNLGWCAPFMGFILGLIISKIQKSYGLSDLPMLTVSALGPYFLLLWLRGTLNGFSVLIAWWCISWLIFVLNRFNRRSCCG